MPHNFVNVRLYTKLNYMKLLKDELILRQYTARDLLVPPTYLTLEIPRAGSEFRHHGQ